MTDNLNQSLEGKVVLVTGSTGYIGRNIIAFFKQLPVFLDHKLKVICAGRNGGRLHDIFPLEEGISHFIWDVQSENELETIQINYLIHLAGEDRFIDDPNKAANIWDAAVNTTQSVLEYANRVSVDRVLIASSGAVYEPRISRNTGYKESEYSPFDQIKSLDPYSMSKRKMEFIASEFAIKNSLDLSIARIFTTVGPYFPIEKPYAIGQFIHKCLLNEEIVITGYPELLRSYQDVRDTCNWLITILLRSSQNQIYNVGSNQSLTISELATLVNKLCKNDKQIKLEFSKKHMNPIDHYIPDIAKASELLGLKNMISLDDAITNTYKYFHSLNS
jgi:dTDP-glucose 4,6-dehydratase